MKVLIYGKADCQYCTRAKVFCEAKSLDFDYVSMDSNPKLKEMLSEQIGHEIKTVPQVFIVEDGLTQYIGGYEDLRNRYGSI